MTSFFKSHSAHRDSQSMMILTMEEKLNVHKFGWFRYKNRKDLSTCKLTTNEYWDWLNFIDDEYLADFDILKMKELYRQQLQELSG